MQSPQPEVVEQPDDRLMADIKAQIVQYNRRHWPAVERRPLAVRYCDDDGVLLAGACGHTFGHWLMLDYLWVDDTQRGKALGSQLLNAMEAAARRRGCRRVLLDTLEFQARPFYEKHGYRLEWTQANYPLDGCKYFMTKELDDDGH